MLEFFLQCMSLVLLGIFVMVMIAHAVRDAQREAGAAREQSEKNGDEDVIIQPQQHMPPSKAPPNLKIVK